jgi:3-oxoacyl-[acyl-carrier-protein] synthase II
MVRPTERLAVTGWGCITPLGASVDATWEATLAGHSGISAVEESWAADLPARIAGRVHHDLRPGPTPPPIARGWTPAGLPW